MIERPLHASVPDAIDATHLNGLLASHLRGLPSDGSEDREATGHCVVWVDRGDEVILHLDSLKTKIGSGVVLISVDLETDQTGRQTLVIPFAVSGSKQDGGLAMTTEALPRGPDSLARRWGETLIEAIYSAFESLVVAHAAAAQASPKSLHLEGEVLHPRPVKRT